MPFVSKRKESERHLKASVFSYVVYPINSQHKKEICNVQLDPVKSLIKLQTKE